jgi:hypothetical protein
VHSIPIYGDLATTEGVFSDKPAGERIHPMRTLQREMR